MINLNIADVPVIFTKPFKGLTAEELAAITSETPEVVYFLDIPPMAGSLQALDQVRSTLPGVRVIWNDHHSTPQAAEWVAKVKAALGTDATLVTRDDHPACSTLVTCGKAQSHGKRVLVLSDNDADGLTASMKLCGLVYAELDADAAILDGPRSGQTKEGGLSELGCLLVVGLSTLPPYDKDNPTPSERAKVELFTKFVAATQGDEGARAWLVKKIDEYQAGVAVAEGLALTATQVAKGVWSVDAGKTRYDQTTLTNLLEAKEGCVVTVVAKQVGPLVKDHGGQISLARRTGLTTFSLRDMLTDELRAVTDNDEKVARGCISNTDFLLHVSPDVYAKVVLPALVARFGKVGDDTPAS